MMQMLSSWPSALGYTLLHSLWQGLIITLVAILTLRFTPSRFSSVRYIIASAAMLLLLLSVMITFVYLYSSTPATHYIILNETTANNEGVFYQQKIGLDLTFLDQVNQYINNHIPILLSFWITGTFLFCIRLASSLWYVNKLKHDATLLNNVWSERLSILAGQLNIKRFVQLAESGSIHVPVVIGYFKPVILVPVGMFSGLSTEQIEAIFLHELSHIRRHDYLINLLQSLIEAIFFFNPFVWVISRIMRTEREHCCDDDVVRHIKNVKAYVHALAQLEEGRLFRAGLALSLATKKNELLNRIKRIMETSVKQNSARERIIPALLIVVGLISASWITLHSNKTHSESTFDENVTLLQDTTKKKKTQKSATYSKKKITTIGPDGKPHEEIIENFEGDESLRPMMINPDFNFDMDFDIDIPRFPDFDGLMPFPPMNFDFRLDSANRLGQSFRHEDWEKFSEQFEKKFKENFGDSFEKQQHELHKMMEELQQNMQRNFNDEWVEKQKEHAERWNDMNLDNEEFLKRQEEWIRKFEEKMKHFDDDKLLELNDNIQNLEKDVRSFNKILKEELLKDGHLKEDERIERLSINEDGTLWVNGKEIPKADWERYQKLHPDYLKLRRNFRYVE